LSSPIGKDFVPVLADKKKMLKQWHLQTGRPEDWGKIRPNFFLSSRNSCQNKQKKYQNICFKAKFESKHLHQTLLNS
jgi:hypothetical protein